MTPAGSQVEWSYAKTDTLSVADGHSTGKLPKGQLIAQLVRYEGTRTPGTSRCTAGNGGELQIDKEACRLLELDETVVVATCLVMLKRESDGVV